MGFSVLTNFLFVPVRSALYANLSLVNRNAMLIASACIGLFVVLETAVNWSCYAALVMFSSSFQAAANDTERAALMAAAHYPSAVLSSPLAPVFAIGTLSLGILVIGFVMQRGLFSKAAAYVAIATGILGFLAVIGFGPAVILNAICATVWVWLVGYELLQFARR